MKNKLLNDEMSFHFCIKLLLVLCIHESTAATENVDVVHVVFEHWHDFIPETFEVFRRAVFAKSAEQVFVVLTAERFFDLK
jgi:hypothetical protein